MARRHLDWLLAAAVAVAGLLLALHWSGAPR
jgi:hypothetical protein